MRLVTYSQSRETGNIQEIRKLRKWRKEILKENSSQLDDTEKWLKQDYTWRQTSTQQNKVMEVRKENEKTNVQKKN